MISTTGQWSTTQCYDTNMDSRQSVLILSKLPDYLNDCINEENNIHQHKYMIFLLNINYFDLVTDLFL